MFSKPPHHEMGTAQTTGTIAAAERREGKSRKEGRRGRCTGRQLGQLERKPQHRPSVPRRAEKPRWAEAPQKTSSGPPVSPWLKPRLLGLSSAAMLRQCADGTGRLWKLEDCYFIKEPLGVGENDQSRPRFLSLGSSCTSCTWPLRRGPLAILSRKPLDTPLANAWGGPR